MKKTKTKQFIISLILDDLIHSRLVFALMDIGLGAEIYMTDTSNKVIRLMGFKGENNEYMFTFYREQLRQVKYVDITQNNIMLLKLAKDIYHDLKLRG